MSDRVVCIPAELVNEVVGFLEGIEKAAGRPLNHNADLWAGMYAKRLRLRLGRPESPVSEAEKHKIIDGLIAELDAMETPAPSTKDPS